MKAGSSSNGVSNTIVLFRGKGVNGYPLYNSSPNWPVNKVVKLDRNINFFKGIQRKFNLYDIIKDDETIFSTKFYLQRFESANAITEKEKIH